MPKIRDLGISTIQVADMSEGCGKNTVNPHPAPCNPTPPQCHPTNKPKYACGLPQQAIIELRQQLRHQISGQLHG